MGTCVRFGVVLGTWLGLGGALLIAGCAGEPRRLAPAEAPSRVMPSMVRLPDTPLPAHRGRVVLDTTNGPMRISAKFDPTFTPPGDSTDRGVTGELCTTPCVVDLPVGKYRLFFSPTENDSSSLGDTDDLIVNEGVTVYRRAPGLYRTPSPTDQIGPVALLVAGTVAATAGSIAVKDDDSRAAGAGLLIGGGVALIGGGIWAYDRSRATQRDGATTVWQLTPPPAAPATSPNLSGQPSNE